jgi:hypothetical protein
MSRGRQQRERGGESRWGGERKVGRRVDQTINAQREATERRAGEQEQKRRARESERKVVQQRKTQQLFQACLPNGTQAATCQAGQANPNERRQHQHSASTRPSRPRGCMACAAATTFRLPTVSTVAAASSSRAVRFPSAWRFTESQRKTRVELSIRSLAARSCCFWIEGHWSRSARRFTIGFLQIVSELTGSRFAKVTLRSDRSTLASQWSMRTCVQCRTVHTGFAACRCVAVGSRGLCEGGSVLTLTGGQILIGITTAAIRTSAAGVAAAWTVLWVGSIMLRCTNAQIV